MSARFICRNFAGTAMCLALLAGLFPSLEAALFIPNDIPRKDFWDTDGTINALVASNGVVYVGGSFSYLAPKGSKLVSLDSATGGLQTDFPSFYGAGIYSILDDGAGGWFVGGSFTRVGGALRTNLVHILSDNSVDPVFEPSPNAPVRCLALDGSRLYIGGEFTALGGQSRNQIGAWDLGAQAVLNWAPQANAAVSSLQVAGTTVYAGGYFSQIGGQLRKNIAALDSATGAALPWNPQGDGAVLAMVLQDQKLFAGGFFNRIGGQLRAGLAALDIGSNNALAWDPNPMGGKVTSLRVVCNTVYVGGYFTNLAGAPRMRAGAVDSETAQATRWNANLDFYYAPNLPSQVLGLEVSGDRVYLAGQYSANGQHDLNAFDAVTGNLLPWSSKMNGGVSALAVSGRRVLAGMISSLGGLARQNLAALDELTGIPLPFAPSVDGPVYALALSGTNLFVGGSFTNVERMPRSRLAAIDLVTGTVRTNWAPAANSTVYALAVDTNGVYAGGNFSTVSGFTRQRLCSLSTATGAVNPTWAPQADGTVYALELASTNLYVGGSFISISGFTRHRLAAFNLTFGNVQPWNPDANQTVRALRSANGKMYVGGSFTSISGQSRNFAGAVDLSLGFPEAWNPGTDDEVRAIAISGTNIFLGGIFLRVSGEQRFGCAAVSSSDSLLPWNPGASTDNRVYAMVVSEKLIYAGGELPLGFEGANEQFALAAFPPMGAPVILQGPADVEVVRGENVNFDVIAEGLNPLTYRWLFNGANLATDTSESSLALTNVQPNQSGTYEIIVSNALGIARAQASVLVLQPVSINTQPVSQLVSPGSSVTLNVSASGNPAPLFQWRLNGVNIPGAVAPTLTLTNVTPGSGGAYYAVVGNKLGAINSQVAQLSVLTSSLPFADNVETRGSISGLSGTGSGNNISATAQPNEPLHAGKAGGRSVWLSWVAPSNGVATFSTRGSVFDTLLGIYTGSGISNLVSVGGDEDRGGFLTSEASFNAVKDSEYLIAVDGLAGASGRIVLHWEMDTTASSLPHITTQPIGQSIPLGGLALFEVAASSPTPLRYQWFFGCQAIRDATNSSLLVNNAQARNVGAYRVFVMNGSSRIAESLPAALEIGDFPGVLSFDKLEDALAVDAGSTNHFAPLKYAALAAASPNILVSIGSIISQTIDTTSGTGFIKETNHCGVIGGASAWLRFQPTQDGTLMVDTIGSRFDTVLAIYRDTNLIVLSSNPGAALVACDNNGAPDGIRSRLTYNTKAGVVYLAVVDGVQSAKGLATIHWQLANAPTIVGDMSNLVGTFRENLTLTSGTASTALNTSYQWLFNGVAIAGATNSTLTLTRLQPGQAGYYSVIVSNFAGWVENTPALVTVNVPLQMDSRTELINGEFHGAIWGNLNDACVLEVSTDLRGWTPINLIYIQAQPQPFSHPDAQYYDKLFYRVQPYSEEP